MNPNDNNPNNNDGNNSPNNNDGNIPRPSRRDPLPRARPPMNASEYAGTLALGAALESARATEIGLELLSRESPHTVSLLALAQALQKNAQAMLHSAQALNSKAGQRYLKAEAEMLAQSLADGSAPPSPGAGGYAVAGPLSPARAAVHNSPRIHNSSPRGDGEPSHSDNAHDDDQKPAADPNFKKGP